MLTALAQRSQRFVKEPERLDLSTIAELYIG
jgi:hypothetical protein